MPCPHFGNYPAEYNRAVHGPYYPWRWYGKVDTPLADVKINQLGSWVARRNKNPVAMAQAVGRAYWRWMSRFVVHPYAGAAPYAHTMLLVCVCHYLANWKTLRHHKLVKHHW